MGAENKLLLPWGDKPVLEVVVNTLVGAGLHEVVVVVGHQAETVAAVLEPYPVRVVTNSDFAAGMSASLRTGIEAADAMARGYLVALGDMPGISTGLVDLLCRRFNEAGRVRHPPSGQPRAQRPPGDLRQRLQTGAAGPIG